MLHITCREQGQSSKCGNDILLLTARFQGEFYEAISASMQTLRLCNRALANLSRLSTVVSKDRSTKQGTEPMGHRLDTLQGRSSSVDRMPSCNASHAQAALGWRITQVRQALATCCKVVSCLTSQIHSFLVRPCCVQPSCIRLVALSRRPLTFISKQLN